ncbi:MAG: sulfatase [Bacteroidales bacterium]
MKLQTYVIPLLLSTLCIKGFARKTKQLHPNILWLTYEDTSPQFIGCYGNDKAITPVMDDLAKEGVRFTNAFSTGTVSSASRFCLITGCRPSRYGTGNHRSNFEIPDFVHGFPEYLRSAGYYTSNNFKTDYNHKNHLTMTRLSWDESSRTASWRKRKPGQPFFAVFNSMDSHQSRTMTNPWNVYKKQVLDELSPKRTLAVDENFEMPAFYNDTPEMRKQVSRVYNSISLTDQHFGEILKKLDEDGLRDSTIIFCFSDHGEGIPRGKGSSLGSGYRIPFIMWIPEMYKDLTPWGSGVISDELVSFEDFGATVLSLCGVEIPSYIEGRPFLPAKKEVKKKYVYGSCDAIDSNSELSRSVTDGHYLYTRVFTCYEPFVRWICYYDFSDIQTYMRKDFASGKLNNKQAEIMKPRVSEYLYDLKSDRWELNNLASIPEYRNKLKTFRKVMKRHLIETKDVNFIPEYTLSLKENEENIIPYYLRLNDEVYPIKDVVNTAMLCGLGEDVINKQIKKVQSNNSIVSYWAAIGLFTQRSLLKPYAEQLIQVLSNVDYFPTRVWLAASILNIKESETARKVINDGLFNSNRYINIYTLNALTEMNLDVAKTFIPKLSEIEKRYYIDKNYDVISMLSVVKLRLEDIPIHYDNFW